MIDAVIIGIILAALALAAAYLVREKKRGRPCVGCPNAAGCSKKDACQITHQHKEKWNE